MFVQEMYTTGWKDGAGGTKAVFLDVDAYKRGWDDGVKARLRAETLALARYGTFDGIKEPNDHARELYHYMSNLSELHWSAGWLGGLEQILWHAIEHGDVLIDTDAVVVLAELFVKAGGWWIWKRGAEDATFVSAAEWRKEYDEKKHLYCKCEESRP